MRGGRMADDFAGMAGGAFSALAGLRRELEQLVRSAVDDMVQRLELVPREEFDAVRAMAVLAREENEALKARLAALEAALAGASQGDSQANFKPPEPPAAP